MTRFATEVPFSGGTLLERRFVLFDSDGAPQIPGPSTASGPLSTLTRLAVNRPNLFILLVGFFPCESEDGPRG